MVSHHIFYQLVLLGLLWLCMMLHVMWPSDRPALALRPPQPVAPPRKRSKGDVSQVLIPSQRDCPNSYRLMKSPITRSCMRSVLEKHSVRRTSRLIRVRRLMCLLSIFCVCSLPT